MWSFAQKVNQLAFCFCADTFPSLKRRGGCGINKKARSLRSAADGVVSSAKLFRPEDFADLFLRLRPIGLALRATPSARTKVASRHFLERAATPPFSRRGIMPDSNSFTRSDTLGSKSPIEQRANYFLQIMISGCELCCTATNPAERAMAIKQLVFGTHQLLASPLNDFSMKYIRGNCGCLNASCSVCG